MTTLMILIGMFLAAGIGYHYGYTNRGRVELIRKVKNEMNTRKWFKSSFSSGGDNCVEVAISDDGVDVRHSKNGLEELAFTRDEWTAFIQGVKAGEFD